MVHIPITGFSMPYFGFWLNYKAKTILSDTKGEIGILIVEEKTLIKKTTLSKGGTSKKERTTREVLRIFPGFSWRVGRSHSPPIDGPTFKPYRIIGSKDDGTYSANGWVG